MSPLLRGALLLAALTGFACGSDDGDGGGGSGGSGSGGGGSGGAPPSCDPDPLETGLAEPAHVDDFDCLILDVTAKYAEPDAMIFKAMIKSESGFQFDAMGCTAPCGTPAGWSADEVKCLGLMQIVMACQGDYGGYLPNGHPNMTTDPSSPLWATSIFNPAVNIDNGVKVVAGNRAKMKQDFAGCTEEQYTLMSIGAYAKYGSTKGCTEYNSAYTDVVLGHYQTYAAAAGWAPHPY